MKKETFVDILCMVRDACYKNLLHYDGMKEDILKYSTQIYIELIKQNRGIEK